MIPLHHSVEFQHHLWDDVLPQANIVVDLTCGNGHDTLYLLQHSHSKAKIYAIDVQKEAIQSTMERWREKAPETYHRVCVLQGSHDTILETYPISNIDLIVANLGYLPNGNHSIMTHEDTTIQAIAIGLQNLSVDGLCTIVAYPGTERGFIESKAVETYLSSIDQTVYHCSTWHPINQKHNPPILYIIRRRK